MQLRDTVQNIGIALLTAVLLCTMAEVVLRWLHQRRLAQLCTQAAAHS
jgi:hypothetical protein